MIAALILKDCIQRHSAFVDFPLHCAFFPDQTENVVLQGQFVETRKLQAFFGSIRLNSLMQYHAGFLPKVLLFQRT